MSAKSPQLPSHPNDLKVHSSTKSNQPDLHDLDARLQRASEKILPPTPYILTVPTRKFPLTPTQVEDWYKGTPFQPHEAHLQYLSFRSDWDHGLITPVGGMLDGKGELIDEEKEKRKSASGTPKVAANKMSLAEYRQRKPGIGAVSGTNGAAKVNGEVKKDAPSTFAEAYANSKDHKRSSDEAKPKEAAEDGQSDRPAKKARLSPSPRKSAHEDQGGETALSLPSPISPTLPPAIERELARLEAEEAEAARKADEVIELAREQGKAIVSDGSNAPSSSDAQSGPALQESTNEVSKVVSQPSPKAAQPIELKTGPKADSSRLKAESSRAAKTTAKSIVKPTESKEPAFPNLSRSKPATKGAESTSTALMSSTGQPLKPRSCVVKLKIPRSRRADYKRLVRMFSSGKQPIPKTSDQQGKLKPQSTVDPDSETSKVPSKRATPTTSDVKIKGVARPKSKPAIKAQDPVKHNEKRPRLEDEQGSQDSPAKRHKSSSNAGSQGRPTTPIPPAFKSPIMSQNSSSQKARDLTPSALGRPDDSVKTPQGSVRNGTPLAPTSVDKNLRPDSSASNGPSRRDDIAALSRERKNYSDLGRHLKHEADEFLRKDHGPSDGSSKRSATEKKGVVVAIETVCAFMLGYAIGDEHGRLSRISADARGSWNTIHGYIGRVLALTEPYPALHGLVLHLAAVSKRVHWALDYEQLAANYAAATPDKHAQLKRIYDDYRRVFADAAAKLGPAEWEKRFPQTWRASARVPLAAAGGRAAVLPLPGDFCVPLTELSTPVEAVRAAKSMLAEWCRAEGVEWSPAVGV